MDGSEPWLPALVVIYVLIVAAMLFYFVIRGSARDRRYEIGDLRRDIGEVQREFELGAALLRRRPKGACASGTARAT